MDIKQGPLFFVQHFKTEECKKVHPAEYNEKCFYYHSLEDSRRKLFTDIFPPNLNYMNILYLSHIIPDSEKLKFCLNLAEYNFHILNYKTKICPSQNIGKNCELAEFCPYIHQSENLSEFNKLRENYKNLISKFSFQFSFDSMKPKEAKKPKEPKMKSSLMIINKKTDFIVEFENGEEGYIQGEKLDFKENLHNAFFYTSDQDLEKNLRNVLPDHICAFANTAGGILHIGINKHGIVKGILANSKVLDKIKLAIDGAVYFNKIYKNSVCQLFRILYNLHFFV